MHPVSPFRQRSFSSQDCVDARSAETSTLSSSSHDCIAGDYRILEPGDFSRGKAQRPRTADPSPRYNSFVSTGFIRAHLTSEAVSPWIRSPKTSQPANGFERVTRMPSRIEDVFETVEQMTDTSCASSGRIETVAYGSLDRSTTDFALTRRRRPHTASTVASNCSHTSSQLSYGSGRRPLLTGQHRDEESLSTGFEVDSQCLKPITSQARETCNAFTQEERRQHVRRSKKLAHILGGEVLVTRDDAVRASFLEFSSQSCKRITSPRQLGDRADPNGSSLNDCLLSEVPGTIGLKAATILGIPHPYSADRPCGETLVDNVPEAAEFDAILAAAKEDRRRRAAKMSRWLGEAVPVDLIGPNKIWNQAGHELAWSQMPLMCGVVSHCARVFDDMVAQELALPMVDRTNTSSPLDSFMSIDSSDSEDDTPSSVFFAGPSATSVNGSMQGDPITSEILMPSRPSALPLAATSWTTNARAEGHVRSASVEEKTPRASEMLLQSLDSDSYSADHQTCSVSDERVGFSSSRAHRSALVATARDKSLSKLSNFFGSTPSQIVRSQCDLAIKTRTQVQEPGLRIVSRSLEDEAMGSSNLYIMRKTDRSRNLRLELKKRTTQLFT